MQPPSTRPSSRHLTLIREPNLLPLPAADDDLPGLPPLTELAACAERDVNSLLSALEPTLTGEQRRLLSALRQAIEAATLARAAATLSPIRSR